MAIGDDATAAGMTLVNGAAAGSAAQIDDYINRAEDYIAGGPAYWKPGVVVAVADGGTGATSASAARTALGITAANVDAIENSGAYHTTLGWNGTRLEFAVPGYAFPTQVANLSDVAGGSDLTLSGQLYVPNSFAAVSGFTIAYINSDGRLSRGSSSERYKKYISAIAPSVLGDIFPQLHRFQMKSLDGTGDGAWHYGYIAERLDEQDDTKAFVVYDQEGRPDSIDFVQLLLAQVAQLREREIDREARFADLLARVETLEAATTP